ncbi:MAG: diaminopimelate epimerase [Legionella sp.]|nr:MAG: diaminopimelate epimerase [Legionella sp.]
MAIQFTKMHGLGNDFMMLDGVHQKLEFTTNDIAQWSQRNTGVGFDQCLIIEPSSSPDIDFNYRIFNADGQEVGQCGNGARCLALFAHRYGLTTKTQLRVATRTTRMQLMINPDKTVTVDMGIPQLKPSSIPLLAQQQEPEYELKLLDGNSVQIHAIQVGNPHAVLLVSDVQTAPVQQLGAQICQHPHFPEQTNVGFMQIISPTHIKLRVFERGAGETQACGSGAVAAVAIGRLYHQLAAEVRVSLPGGDLIIHWPNKNEPILLTGPATFVYEGSLL